MLESPERENDRGFTLIEVMIVTAIIGVLAVLGSVGYFRWIASSKMAEATNMIAGIKNGQENYHSQTGMYLNISGGLIHGYTYPRTTPGPGKAAWDSGDATVRNGFERIGVKSDAPMFFGYASMAGGDACDPACAAATLTLSTGNVDWVKENGGAPIAKPWFIASAQTDQNGNGVYATVASSSINSRMIVDREGE